MSMPPPPPGWYEPPKPEKEQYKRELYITLVIVMVVVLVSVGLFAYSYITIPKPIDGFITEPNIQFASPEPVGLNQWQIMVAGVSDTEALSNFRAVLTKNGSLLQTIDDLESGGGGDFSFTDIAGEGDLSVADHFTVTCEQGSSYALYIIWRDSGNARGETDWET